MVPLGVFFGNILSDLFGIMRAQTLGLLFGFIFGGIALVTAYFLERKFERTDEED